MGHCGVQFRLAGDGSPQDPCGFGFGTLWPSVQADGIWFPQNPLGLQFWGIVGFSSGACNLISGPICASVGGILGFSSGAQEMGGHRTHVVSALGDCWVQFRLMESDLRNSWGLSFRTLWGSVQADRSCVITGPTWFWLWYVVGFSSGRWNLVSSGPSCASVLGHCWVQFRLMEYDVFRACWRLSFGTL